MASRDLSPTPGARLPAANHQAEPATTKAADWFAARLQGRRLPGHDLEEEIALHNFTKEHTL